MPYVTNSPGGGLGDYYGDELGKISLKGISLKKIGKAVKKVAAPVQKLAAKVAAPVIKVAAKSGIPVVSQAAKVASFVPLTPKKKPATRAIARPAAPPPTLGPGPTSRQKPAPVATISRVDSGPAVVRRKAYVPPPSTKKPTVAEQAATGKKVVGIGAKIRQKAKNLADTLKTKSKQLDKVKDQAAKAAAAGDAIGAKKFSDQARAIEQTVANVQAQASSAAATVETAGAAAEGAAAGAVAGAAGVPDLLRNPWVIGGGVLALGLGAYFVMRPRRSRAA